MAGIEQLEIHSKVSYRPPPPNRIRLLGQPVRLLTCAVSEVVYCAMGQGRRGAHNFVERPASQEVDVGCCPTLRFRRGLAD
jgi:hypothetical protein